MRKTPEEIMRETDKFIEKTKDRMEEIVVEKLERRKKLYRPLPAKSGY